MGNEPRKALSMLSGPTVRQALESLGYRLPAGRVVDLLLVGGAGGMLAGRLPGHRTTADCDVMVCAPLEAWDDLKAAASEVATEFGLAETWMNDGARAFRDTLLPGWEDRRELVLEAGSLRVSVPGRVDFIAMKVFAGRAQDYEDLDALNVTTEEWAFVRKAIEYWTHDHWPDSRLREALATIDDLERA
jgi:hypothetical protein